MTNNSILIADSGSTKTDWLFARDGESFFQFQSGGLNPFYQDKDEIIALLNKEVIPNLPHQVDKVFFYGAGCADSVTSKPAYDALMQTIPGVSKLEVTSDMLGAARGLCGNEAGITCILGTGANNALYDGSKIVRSIGSLGFWLGDEGSGSYLGKTLLVHYLQHELPRDLHDEFAKLYPEINRLSVLDNAYRKPFPNRYFAAFTRFISENMHHSFLREMVGDAFKLFVEKYIIKHPESRQYKIHFTGSVAFHFQEILKDVLAAKGLEAGRIVKSPLTGLTEYHLEPAV